MEVNRYLNEAILLFLTLFLLLNGFSFLIQIRPAIQRIALQSLYSGVTLMKTPFFVIPAKAGIHNLLFSLDSLPAAGRLLSQD